MAMSKTIPAAVLAAVFHQTLAPASAKPALTTFDPPGSISTDPTSINASGAIAGDYQDSQSINHGFIRSPAGSFTSFDPPGSTETKVFGINAPGAVVGQFTDNDGVHCFVRNQAGGFTTFDPQPAGLVCYALGINKKGEIAGYEYESRHDAYGFLRKGNGAISSIPGRGYTVAAAVNDVGVTAGFTASDGAAAGFVRTRAGTVTIFDAPGDTNGTVANSINAKGWIAGYFTDGNAVDHSFVRSLSGTITDFDPPGAHVSQASGINTKGQIAGYYYDIDGYAGYVRSSGGTFKSISAPGAVDTFPYSINDAAAVTGYYLDGSYQAHGFLWMP